MSKSNVPDHIHPSGFYCSLPSLPHLLLLPPLLYPVACICCLAGAEGRRRRVGEPTEEARTHGHGGVLQGEASSGGERPRALAGGRGILRGHAAKRERGGAPAARGELLRGIRAGGDPRGQRPSGRRRLLLHRPVQAHRSERVPGRRRRGVPGGRGGLRRLHRRRLPPQGLHRHVRLLRLPRAGPARRPPADHGQGTRPQGGLLLHPCPHLQRRHRRGRRRGQAFPLRQDEDRLLHHHRQQALIDRCYTSSIPPCHGCLPSLIVSTIWPC